MSDNDQKQYQDYLDQHEYQQYLSSQQQAPVSAPKAAAAGAAQGLSLGYTPQVVGGLVAGIGKLRDYFNPMIGAKSGQQIPSQDYTKARDSTVKELGSISNQQPAAYMAGQIGANLALPGPGLAAKGGLASKIGAGAATGAGYGAAYNPGDKEGIVDPLQASNRASNAMSGAELGGVMGGALGALQKASSPLAQYFMAKGTGINKFKSLKDSSDTAAKMSQSLIDQGMWGTRKSMQTQAANNLSQLETKLMDQAKSSPGVDSSKVAAKIGELVEKYKADSIIPADSGPKLSEILNRASDVADRGTVSGPQALKLSRIAEENAYKVAPGEVRPGLFPELGRAEGRGYKSELASQNPEVQPILDQQRANILARNGLKNTPTQSPVETSLEMIAGGPAAVLGGVAAKAPIVNTGLAQILSRTPKQASKLQTPVLQQALEAKRNTNGT